MPARARATPKENEENEAGTYHHVEDIVDGVDDLAVQDLALAAKVALDQMPQRAEHLPPSAQH